MVHEPSTFSSSSSGGNPPKKKNLFEFEKEFDQLYPYFLKNLSEAYPGLTSRELLSQLR